MLSVSENFMRIQRHIKTACERSGNDFHNVRVLAVTKFQTEEQILEAYACGLRCFAENRLQIAKDKVPALRHLGEWHFIGRLQSNKARAVVELFDVIQSVDSLKLACKLSDIGVERKQPVRIYLQVNISGEAQKGGFEPQHFIRETEEIIKLPGLKLEGLMGMAAWLDDAEQVRPSFRQLKQLAKELEARTGELICSMGMSNDYAVAVEEGAGMVRIGTTLFETERS